MDLNKIVRFALMIVIVCFLNFQCKDPDIQAGPCDCQSKTIRKEIKNVEAVVVRLIGNNPLYGYQGPDQYILSTEPRDFEDSTYASDEPVLCRWAF